MSRSICFAYYANGQFIGWYADSFGSVRTSPKLYSDLEKMRPIITKNLTTKLRKINESSFEEAKEKTTSILGVIGLATFDSEDVLRGKEIELRVVECPIYDGPNPDFDKAAYEAECEEYNNKFKAAGVDQIPGPSMQRSFAVTEFNKTNPRPKCNNWTYADYSKVKEWAANEPTEFIEVIKPDV